MIYDSLFDRHDIAISRIMRVIACCCIVVILLISSGCDIVVGKEKKLQSSTPIASSIKTSNVRLIILTVFYQWDKDEEFGVMVMEEADGDPMFFVSLRAKSPDILLYQSRNIPEQKLDHTRGVFVIRNKVITHYPKEITQENYQMFLDELESRIKKTSLDEALLELAK